VKTSRRLLGAITVIAIVATGSSLALAATPMTLFLAGDSVPQGSMGTGAPGPINLPNFDPGRDSSPGLLLAKSDQGSSETDPTKYQQWEYDVSGQTLSVSKLVIWAAPKDFDVEKTVRFATFLMACDSTCTVLDTATRIVAGATDWKQLNIPLVTNGRDFGASERLVVKITVLDNSDDDMWFAYATATYDARISVKLGVPTPTTSTTTTTTTSATTTTTVFKPEAATTTTTNPGAISPPTVPTETTTTTVLITGEPGGEAITAPTTTTTSVAPGDFDAGAKTVVGVGLPLALAVDLSSTSGDGLEIGLNLDPQEGLMVVFTTATENIQLYWPVAVGLGLLASVLLWIGLRQRESDDEHPRLEG